MGAVEAKKGGHAMVGGILTLLAGIIGVVVAVLIFLFLDIFVGIALIALAIIAIIGGAFAMQRKMYGFAVTGGICAIIGGAFFLGIPGLILILMGKNEFT